MPKSVQARDNFFGLFATPKEEALTVMAPEDYAAIIADVQKLAAPFSGQVDAYLIHAPDRLGRNYWYFFATERPPSARMFENASTYSMPKELIKSKTPWKDVRANLNTFRRPEQVQFVVIDAISGKTEGPLSLSAIAKRNPRRRRKTARRNPGKDMHGQDLRKKNFRGADLWGAQLWRSNLSGVNLSNATLAQAAIWEADLSGANLSGAELGEANLAGSNLTGANLRGAKMVDTNIDGADFSEADLRGTDLGAVMFPENARFMDALYDDKTEWPWNIEDPEMQVGARHERTMVLNPRRRMARRNGTALADRLSELLGLLHTAKSVAWVAHWNAKGPNFYGTHLMFQRIYEELDEPIDELGERYVAYTRSPVKYHAFRGEDVDVPTDAQAAANLLDSILGVAQQTSDMARSIANREVSGRSAAGLDDYLMALNNTLDTFRYLLYRYAGD